MGSPRPANPRRGSSRVEEEDEVTVDKEADCRRPTKQATCHDLLAHRLARLRESRLKSDDVILAYRHGVPESIL